MSVAAVTPRGVREGQREALEGLVARRGPAVLAYCAEVCAPDVAPRAAAEAFARFRAAVHDAPDLASVDPESLLVSATRHAAASFAQPAPPHKRRKGGKADTCELVPMLLAARAAGALGPADRERLARHLQRCEGCREVEAAFLRAERAYRHPPRADLPRATAGLLVAALTAAAPVGPLPDDAEPDVVDDALERPGDTAEREALAAEALAEVAVETVDVESAAAPAGPEPEPESESESEPNPEREPEPEPEPVPELEPEFAPDPKPAPEADREGPTGMITLPRAAKVDPPPLHSPRGLRRPVLPTLPKLAAPSLPAVRVNPRVALPIAVICAAVLVSMGAAGVFSGSDPTPPQTDPEAASKRLEEPVTTPLPVRVKKPKPAPATTTPETETTPGTQTTPAAPGATDVDPDAGDTDAGTGNETGDGNAGAGNPDDAASRSDSEAGGTGAPSTGEPDEAPVFEETQTTTTP